MSTNIYKEGVGNKITNKNIIGGKDVEARTASALMDGFYKSFIYIFCQIS